MPDMSRQEVNAAARRQAFGDACACGALLVCAAVGFALFVWWLLSMPAFR